MTPTPPEAACQPATLQASIQPVLQEHEVAVVTAAASAPPVGKRAPIQPVLEALFDLYPYLFGDRFLPLKLGTYQELLARHPERFERSSLKAALGVHTRSTRYLQSVAAGSLRHSLDGMAIEAVAPEHVCLAILELYKRRQARGKDDARSKALKQLVATLESASWNRLQALEKIQPHEAVSAELLEEALTSIERQRAKSEALTRAFQGSGKTLEEFAAMYGMPLREVKAAVDRMAPVM